MKAEWLITTTATRMKRRELQGKTGTGLLQRPWMMRMRKVEMTETLIWMMKLIEVMIRSTKRSSLMMMRLWILTQRKELL